MFAIIKTGGKQYKIIPGDIVKLEYLGIKKGENIVFDKVLMIQHKKSLEIGNPILKNATVQGKILENKNDKKVLVFKKRRRHNSRRLNGHKRMLTIVRINEILLNGESLLKYKESAKKEVEQSNNKKTKDKDEKKKKDLKGAKDGN